MIMLGPVLKLLGFAAKVGALVAAPVGVVLAWGAIENQMDKSKRGDDATSS